MNSKDQNVPRQPKRSKTAAASTDSPKLQMPRPPEGANVTEVVSTIEEAVKDATEAGDATGPQTELTRGSSEKLNALSRKPVNPTRAKRSARNGSPR